MWPYKQEVPNAEDMVVVALRPDLALPHFSRLRQQPLPLAHHRGLSSSGLSYTHDAPLSTFFVVYHHESDHPDPPSFLHATNVVGTLTSNFPLQTNPHVFRQTAVFVLGAYAWYLLLTLKDVELRLLTGKMHFHVAHIPYLLARYANLCELLTIVVASYIKIVPHSCGPTATPVILTAIVGNVALAAASTNLAFRSIVLWKSNRWISRALIAVCIVHIIFAAAMGGFAIDAKWDSEHQICVISDGKTQRGLLSVYCFTLVWNLVIVVITAIGIRRSELPRNSPLTSTLYHQSFVYAIVTCATCIPMAVVVYLDFNSIMNVIPAILGTTITVVVSCAAVTSLLKLRSNDESSAGSDDRGPRHAANDTTKTEASPVGALTTHINLGSVFRDSSDIPDMDMPDSWSRNVLSNRVT
ncbi:hypothetical protein BDW22DRAFT_1481824 [Trametopsis cervina]|nr:hypothetical protein BDW22DRAFT_1481824 [Trametopsis cervina]